MPNTNMQGNLGFMISQTAHIETEVFNVKYPEIQYPDLIDVDVSASPWAKTVTYFSANGTGRAQFMSGKANDLPMIATSLQQSETSVELAAIGYDYGIEEVSQASELGLNLDSMKAQWSRRAYEELTDETALFGSAAFGWRGLFNTLGVTTVVAPNGASASPLWSSKTVLEIVKDINDAITGVYTGTRTTGLADTVLVPWERLSPLASIVLPGTDRTAFDFIQKNNLYTMQTGQPLKIRGVRGLLTAGGGATARMVAYRKSPEVMKLHLPLPLMFMEPQIQGLRYVIPGIFRLGGLDIRLPGEVRYVDGF